MQALCRQQTVLLSEQAQQIVDRMCLSLLLRTGHAAACHFGFTLALCRHCNHDGNGGGLLVFHSTTFCHFCHHALTRFSTSGRIGTFCTGFHFFFPFTAPPFAIFVTGDLTFVDTGRGSPFTADADGFFAPAYTVGMLPPFENSIAFFRVSSSMF